MFRPVGAALVLLVIQAAFTAHLAPLIGATTTVYAYASCFLTYAAILFIVRREQPTVALVVGIAGTAFLIRAVLAFAEPTLSDDIFRYVWEGRVTLAGFNPFVHAPNADALAAVRDELIWPRVNHPEVPTIYPPLAQLLFAGVGLVQGETTLLRLILLGAEAAAVFAVWRLVPPHPSRVLCLAIYLLNPLVIMEVAWSGHLDVLAWSTLVPALLIVRARSGLQWSAAAGALLGVSIGTKLLAVLLVPYLLFGRIGRTVKERVVIVTTAALIVAGGYAIFADAGPRLFTGFGTYAASWRSNDGVFRGWESLSWITLQQGEQNERLFEFPEFDALALDVGFTKQWEGKTIPNTTFATNQLSQTVAKALAAVVVLFALLFCVTAIRDPILASLVVLLALYLVAPTVHPWYVAWLVPHAALRPNATALAFSATVLASYVGWMSYAGGGTWGIPWWVAFIEYGLVVAVLIWEVGRSRST